MSQEGLVPLSLDGFVAFFASLAVVNGVVLWREHKKKERHRKRYLSQFNATHLRMSRYKIGLVYHIVVEDDVEVTVVPVWDHGRVVIDGVEEVLTPDTLIPFDKTRFA